MSRQKERTVTKPVNNKKKLIDFLIPMTRKVLSDIKAPVFIIIAIIKT